MTKPQTSHAKTGHPRRLQRAVDASLGRLMHLPRATGGYVVTEDIPINMADGVTLLADHYAPTGPALGTVLIRSPYGRNQLMTSVYTRPYAARGYHVVLVRCRGTFGSGGAWEPMIHESADAGAVVAWLREQPWFGGRFVSLGASYLGFTQWAMLMDPPPELVAAIVQVGPHDFAEAIYPGGAFALADMLGWSDIVSRQEEFGLLRGALRMASTGKRIAPDLQRVPLTAGAMSLPEEHRETYLRWMRSRDLDDPQWSPMRLGAALDRVEVPVLIHTGWQDIFLQQALQQYRHLRSRGVDVAITVGPWQHLDIEGPATPLLTAESLDWMAEHLAGRPRARTAPVKVHVTGDGRWCDLSEWPPEVDDLVLHPLVDGRLGDRPAPLGASASFTYDPAAPTPSVGGRVMFVGGRKPDRALAERPDVLSFTGPPLTQPLEVFGTPVVQLDHHSDNPHADVFVRVSDVDANGKSVNVTEGFVRLNPDVPASRLRIQLDDVAHSFATGHSIRLLVAGGSHPRWERNLGTGGDPSQSSDMAASHRTIDLAETSLSLPVRRLHNSLHVSP